MQSLTLFAGFSPHWQLGEEPGCWGVNNISLLFKQVVAASWRLQKIYIYQQNMFFKDFTETCSAP